MANEHAKAEVVPVGERDERGLATTSVGDLCAVERLFRGVALSADEDVKAQVRAFYDSVGWKQIGEGIYQNARYEDLRPVSREYIQRCHLRLGKYLPRTGRQLLDAGSGPIQYPEYLEYSKGFQHRVCLDISRLALVEARERIRGHGLYVVGDIANLPFRGETFEGVVSLHTIHHLPGGEHQPSFFELYRVLRPSGRAVVVYSWGSRSPLMRLMAGPIAVGFWSLRLYRRLRRLNDSQACLAVETPANEAAILAGMPGTFTYKHNYRWVREYLSALPELEVRVWRTVSTAFLRAFIHRRLFGGVWLRFLYWLEERAPHFLGRVGQYPMILFRRPAIELPTDKEVA